MMKCVGIAAGLLLSMAPAALAGTPSDREVDDLAGPPAEIVAAGKLELPALPSFELPPSEPGFVGARELRVQGRRHLGTEVKVKGHVIWIYDCVTALAGKNPKAKRAALQRSIDQDPTLCEIPKLAIADSKTAGRDQAITVVEVPRPPNKLERRMLPAQELARWPAVPKVAVGDLVVVTGQWTTRAPRGDADSDGLLVYGSLTAAAAAPSAPATPAAPATRVASDEDAPPSIVTAAPLRKVVATRTRADSITRLGECHRAANARDFDLAIRTCRAATTTWEGNHLAWYTLASAYMAKGQWPQAREAVTRAVTLRPDLAMYQLYHGVALYEEEQQAGKDSPGDAGSAGGDAAAPRRPDAGRAAMIAARDALRRAVRLNPALWRAHFYLARAYRELDDARRAAEQLAATIEVHPSYSYAYVALVELLRRWSHLDSALAIAQLGTRQLSGDEAAAMWFSIGLLHEERKAAEQGSQPASKQGSQQVSQQVNELAIDAFTRALELRPEYGRARLQRGQLLLRAGKLPAARLDLEAALRSPEPQLVAMRPFIEELLARTDGKKRR